MMLDKDNHSTFRTSMSLKLDELKADLLDINTDIDIILSSADLKSQLLEVSIIRWVKNTRLPLWFEEELKLHEEKSG